MKFLGILLSKRGHQEKDYLLRMSLGEVKYLRRVVAADLVKQSKVKRETGKIYKDVHAGITVSTGINSFKL